MIEIQGLTKHYGRGATAVRALDGLDLQIAPGMFGLLGPNGAGKTTLMRTLAGIVRPSSGTVRVAGHDLDTEAGRVASKSILGYLPQDLGMYGELSAAQFVDYMAILKGLVDSKARARRVAEVLAMVALEEHAHRKIGGPTPVEPGPGATIVSMLHLGDGIQYRWVGPRESVGPTAETVRPSLEDGYMWLMRKP